MARARKEISVEWPESKDKKDQSSERQTRDWRSGRNRERKCSHREVPIATKTDATSDR